MKPREVTVVFRVHTDAPLTFLRKVAKVITLEMRENYGHHWEPIGSATADVAEASKPRPKKKR